MAAALTDAQIMAVVKAAGWTGADAVTAVAVALAESGGDPTATNSNTNGSSDSGLFQINSIHKTLIASGNVFDPAQNARMAFQIYKDVGNKFTPWVAYTRNKHSMFKNRAEAAAGAGDSAVVPVNNSSPIDGDGNTSINITDKESWKRIALFIAGAALLLLLAIKVTGAANLIPVARVAKMARKV